MAYNKTIWVDRSTELEDTFILTENPDLTVTLTEQTGDVYAEGTPVNAINMNKIENGVSNSVEKASVVNNVVTTVEGTVLDGRVGKFIQDEVDEINTNLTANGKKYQADYQDTKYGFTVDGVFYPFGSGAELLWTNSAPTSAFTAQTVALDLSEYVGVAVIAKTQATIDDKSRTVSIGGIGNANYNILSATNATINVVGRPFKSNTSGVVFSNAYYSNNIASNVNIIPLYIFGLKNMFGFEDYLN